jgi:heme oxygenase
MSLKELTKESHTAAENTKFMQAVFKKKMPLDVWADFTHQKCLIYNAIEGLAGSLGLLEGMQDVRRTYLLFEDYLAMTNGKSEHSYRKTTLDYYTYLIGLYPDSKRVLAHLYTWHLGDMHGGQMIKKILPGSHKNLEFENAPELIKRVRALLDDSMADEANLAFDWAMKLMKEYDNIIDL